MLKNDSIEKARHSFAHVMASAIQKLHPGAEFGVGPVIENGFYYDVRLGKKNIGEEDLSKIEAEMKAIIARHEDFTRTELSIADALKLFKKLKQPFKIELITDVKKYGTTNYDEIREEIGKKSKGKKPTKISVYQTGSFVDLCRGPHVKNTSELNPSAFKLTKISGAYWRGSEKNPQMTRIYGTAFETKEDLEGYIKLQEEIEKRDHRMLGEKLDLFSQHGIAPGAIFWHPKGMVLWRVLETLIRKKLDAFKYGEISTPVMVKKEVFEKSGHWTHYREHMFTLKVDEEDYALKPMNCPESTYIYASRLRSYRDLPIRYSEVTDKLHRNELSGTLGGLFRVRQLSQDDAHIYCAPEQIESEIRNLLNLIQEVYKKFDLPVSFTIATKPDKAMGAPALWKKAESALFAILEKTGKPFLIKEKDGAFYGPKIDIHIKDAIGRDWQLATVQLDFQLAERFDLTYTDANGNKERPVVIHRAIFGTFERFLGILIEHYAGAFPFWLSPVQVAILPVNDKVSEYCKNIQKTLEEKNIRVDLNEKNETIGKKIRETEMQKIPYMLIIGEKEQSAGTVSVRERGAGDKGQKTLDDFLIEITLKQ